DDGGRARYHSKDDRYPRASLLHGTERHRTGERDDVDVGAEEFRGKTGKLVYPALSIPYFEDDVLALDVSKAEQAFAKCSECVERSSRLPAGQIPNSRHLLDLCPQSTRGEGSC